MLGVFSAGASAAVWKPQSTGAVVKLHSVSCPTTTTCWAFGDGGTVLRTTNGGTTWTPQSSGVVGGLRGTCPSTSTCIAIGDAGTVIRTTNGGSTWSAQSSGTPHNLRGISCVGTSICTAVGGFGTVIRTTDGGVTWVTQPTGSPWAFRSVSCTSTSFCVATGDSGTVYRTTDGGASWTRETSGTPNGLFGVECLGASTCVAVGLVGTIRRSSDGGVTWSHQASGTTDNLRGVTCTSTAACYAVGDLASFRATTNGGTTSWTSEDARTSRDLDAVTCPASTTCFAAGDGGTILSARFPTSLSLAPSSQTRAIGQTATVSATVRDQGGQPLDGVSVTFNRSGANGAAQDTRTTNASGVASYTYTGTAQGTDTVAASVPNTSVSSTATVTWGPDPLYPSGGCDTGGTNVFDGYSGDAYLKLRTMTDPMSPGTTWVCIAVDAGGRHFGGRAVVSGAVTDAVTIDDNHEDCDANPGSRVTGQDGAVGPVPFDLDVHRFGSGDVWVCVMINDTTVAKRVKIDAAAASAVTFLPDAAAPFPLYVERPPGGSASAACQGAPSGRTRVLNADVGTGHVWLYTWAESSTRVHTCARVEGPGGAQGGRLTLDGNGAPSAATVDSSSDFTPCGTNLLTLGTPPLALKTSGLAMPAWVCVRADTTYRRVKLDSNSSGSLAAFTPDA